MILAVDIGNTNITLGVFKNKKLIGKGKIPAHGYYLYAKGVKQIFKEARLEPEDIHGVIISSVVPLALARFIACLNRVVKCRISITGKDIKIPVKNLYRIKGQVGQDRLVNAFAAKSMYGTPAVIIDFGTAITFDIVSPGGEYLGGLILPGIEMGLASLYKRTALLPKVKLTPSSDIIGKDTVNSMRGGILFGYGAMCDGLVAKYRSILGRDMKVIATGGNAALMKKYSRSIEIVDEDLTLKGLLAIHTTL